MPVHPEPSAPACSARLSWRQICDLAILSAISVPCRRSARRAAGWCRAAREGICAARRSRTSHRVRCCRRSCPTRLANVIGRVTSAERTRCRPSGGSLACSWETVGLAVAAVPAPGRAQSVPRVHPTGGPSGPKRATLADHAACGRVAVFGLLVSAFAGTVHAEPSSADTWPGFRGHEMSGVAATAKIPERWSTDQNVKWAVPIPGSGWSSADRVGRHRVRDRRRSAATPVQEADARTVRQRLHRRDAGAGPPDEEIMQAPARARQRVAGGSGRHPLHGLRARRAQRQVVWEREANKTRRSAAAIARTPTRPKPPSPTASGCTSRSARTSACSATRSTEAAVEEALGAAADLSRLRHRLVTGRRTTAAVSPARQRGAARARGARCGDRRGDVAQPSGRAPVSRSPRG